MEDDIWVYAIFAILAIGIVCALFLPGYQKTHGLPANLSFELDFPQKMFANQISEAYVNVKNRGGYAWDAKVTVSSDAVISTSEPFSLETNTSMISKVTLSANDVNEDAYPLSVQIEYTDSQGTHSTGTEQISLYILPAVEVTDVRWYWDLSHLSGKSTIGKTDDTELYFKVRSKSNSVIYEELKATLSSSVVIPGLTVTPSLSPIEKLGPKGTSSEHSFKISSNSSPPGEYLFTITVYTKGGVIYQKTVQLWITA